MRSITALRATVVAVLCATGLLAATPASLAADPGRWIETGHTNVPFQYFQGVTSDQQRNLYFDGVTVGLYRTDPSYVEQKSNPNAIPPSVSATERYNHIGDLTWDKREGGRLLLPLECYSPFFGNFCFTGSIGVADPDTLEWRYYVKLDPAFIPKAMWAEVSPNGKLLWTSSGNDLLAYDMDEITPANAAPAGPQLKPVRRLVNAVPPSGITGATFYKHRLLVAGQDSGPFQVWSIDTEDGSRQLEIEKQIIGESEGLDIVKNSDGFLQWLITPLGTGISHPPTYGPLHSALVHFDAVHGGKGPES